MNKKIFTIIGGITRLGGVIAASYLINKGANKLCYIGVDAIECSLRRQEGFVKEGKKNKYRSGKLKFGDEWIDATEDKLDRYGNPMYKTKNPKVKGRKNKEGYTRFQSYDTFKPNYLDESNKILKEECEDIERTFYNWAFGGGCKNNRLGGAINPAQWLYEYYYEDDDNALYYVAEEFSDEFGCDIDEVYEIARKAANNYFHYNPDYEREEMNDDDENEEIEECVKRSLKES